MIDIDFFKCNNHLVFDDTISNGVMKMKKILEKIILIGGWIVAAAQAIINVM